MRNQTKAWLRDHPEQREEYRTKSKLRYYTSQKGRMAAKNNKVRRYGLTIEEYDQMYAQQLGLCRICHKPHPSLNIDHKHVDGFDTMPFVEKKKYVRGLLCSLCNRAIGFMKEDPERLRAAANYLELKENT